MKVCFTTFLVTPIEKRNLITNERCKLLVPFLLGSEVKKTTEIYHAQILYESYILQRVTMVTQPG